MARSRVKTLYLLRLLNLGICLTAVSVVVLLHTYTENFYDYLRMPQFLQAIDPQLGFSYPVSLHVYQFILVFAVVVSFINGIGLFNQSRRLNKTSYYCSFISLFVVLFAASFLVYFIAVGHDMTGRILQTMIIYFFFTLGTSFTHFSTWAYSRNTYSKK